MSDIQSGTQIASHEAAQTPSVLDDFAMDTVLQGASSEQRVVLLGSLDQDRSTTVSELTSRVINACGFSKLTYFPCTTSDALRRLPDGLVDWEDTNAPNAEVVLTSLGHKAVVLGANWLRDITHREEFPTERSLSLVNIWGQPTYDHTELLRSGHWRVYKTLRYLDQQGVRAGLTLKNMLPLLDAGGMPITNRGLTNVLERLATSDLVDVKEVVKKAKVWGVTRFGHTIGKVIFDGIDNTRSSDAAFEDFGLAARDRYIRRTDGPTTELPLFIKRAKVAAGAVPKRLIEVEAALRQYAIENGGDTAITTRQAREILGDPKITHSILSRIFEQLPSPVITEVTPYGGGHDGNLWKLSAKSATAHYVANGHRRNTIQI